MPRAAAAAPPTAMVCPIRPRWWLRGKALVTVDHTGQASRMAAVATPRPSPPSPRQPGRRLPIYVLDWAPRLSPDGRMTSLSNTPPSLRACSTCRGDGPSCGREQRICAVRAACWASLACNAAQGRCVLAAGCSGRGAERRLRVCARGRYWLSPPWWRSSRRPIRAAAGWRRPAAHRADGPARCGSGGAASPALAGRRLPGG